MSSHKTELPRGDAQERAATSAETSAAWTPGPWVIDEVCICALDGLPVAQTCRADEFWTLADDDMPQAERERIAANAQLISAAPDMYEALRAARDAVEGHFDDNCDVCREAIDMIRAALAKAEGQS